MLTIFGSIIMDHVFRVDHNPAPGETILSEGLSLHPGGKGANQALAARRAGADVTMVGAVGALGIDDPVLANLRTAGVDLAGVKTTDAPTGMAAISVAASGENAIMVALGANSHARADQVGDDLLGPDNILLVQMELDRIETETLIERARRMGTTIILNLAPALPISNEALSALDYLIVNEGELLSLSPQGDAAGLAQQHDCIVITTLGAKGAAAVTPVGEAVSVPSLPITPVDTTGAGDCFSGAFAAALAQGHKLESALQRAAIAGSLACTKLGAQSAQPTKAEIDENAGA
ncbi:MAG: ribokinase [Alphaproteobacteria bacterium]